MSFKLFTAASAILAFTGLASAATNSTMSPYGNSTTSSSSMHSSSTASPVSTSNMTSEALFCPQLSGDVYVDGRGFSYLIECGINHFGVVIDVSINATSVRRQAATRPASLGDCLALCDATTSCVGTAFNTAERSCTLFSSVGAAYADAGIDFAMRVASGAATTVPAGGQVTSTIYSTGVVTVSSCAPTVTNCPLRANAVVTEIVAVSSTVYQCPAATVLPIAPVACACAYSASTATIYSSTVVNGAMTAVPVSSTVIAVPYPTGTAVSTTTVVCKTCPAAGMATAGPVGASGVASNGTASATKSSGMAVFTGAAAHVKAGMGMMAVVAGAAALL